MLLTLEFRDIKELFAIISAFCLRFPCIISFYSAPAFTRMNEGNEKRDFL